MESLAEPAISILAVDDVPQNLAAIDAVLTRPGLRILKAASGTEALELLLVEDVAVALVDVQMPGMSGFELAELMRGAERTRAIPIIFMTAATRDPARTFRGYEAGAVDFLYKPLEPLIVQSKVNVLVELYSQRKRLSAQLDELRGALRLNEMFAAVLGHDLRNPLNAIAVGAEVLLRQPDSRAVVETAERIRASSRRMAKMIEDLLNIARIRVAGVALAPRRADLLRVCESIRDELERASAIRRTVVTVRGSTEAVFDVDRLAQVFSNLIGNALQHADRDTPIAVDIDGADVDSITARVANEGLIPAERMPSLFEPFQRASNIQGGFGLGLYIAKQFVEAHGGRIEVRSSGNRTVVEFSLPRNPPESNRRVLAAIA